LPKNGIITSETRSSSCCRLSCHSASASSSVEIDDPEKVERGDGGGDGEGGCEMNEAAWLKDSESTEPDTDEPVGV